MTDLAQPIHLTINGYLCAVRPGTTVAAALLQANALSRRSVSSQPRQPLCGMGICFECRVRIDGHLHQRSCQIECLPNMQVTTE